MSEFSRSRLLANITYLTKEKNIRIGDLEAEAGVSTGYFSRLNKSDSTALPSIEVLAAVAKQLNVSIDSLVKVDYESLTASERYLVDFLQKVLADTDNSEVEWDKETTKSMNAGEVTEEGDPVNPLFRRTEEFMGADHAGEPTFENRLLFNSYYHNDATVVLTHDEAYHAKLNGSDFWLFDVTVEIAERITSKELELYLIKGRKAYPVCHTNEHCSSINELLFSLYMAAITASTRPKVNATVKSAIDLYMENLPF